MLGLQVNRHNFEARETRGGMSEADTPHERIADDADASDDAKEQADDAEPMDDDAVADEKGKPRGTACSD